MLTFGSEAACTIVRSRCNPRTSLRMASQAQAATRAVPKQVMQRCSTQTASCYLQTASDKDLSDPHGSYGVLAGVSWR